MQTHDQQVRSVAQDPVLDAIDAYPDFHELLSEATAEPFPIHGADRIRYVKERVERIRNAIWDGDDNEAGRCLRELIEGQIREWQS